MSADEATGSDDVPVWTLTIAQFKELIGEVVREELERRSDHVPTLLTASHEGELQ